MPWYDNVDYISDTRARFEPLAPEHQETAAAILEGMGHEDVANQLRTARMSYQFAEYDNWDGGTYVFDVHLNIDARDLSNYSDEVCDQIIEALNKLVAAVESVWLGKIIPMPTITRNRAVTNQALDPTQKPPPHSRHRMRFRGQAEVQMFDALAEKQRQLPRGDTILIVPLPSVWTGEYRWEPDFIVTYQGRVGVIEIDDPTHSRRWAFDKSKDQVLEECGVHVVRRIAVEDAADPEQCKQFIDIFLQRLTR